MSVIAIALKHMLAAGLSHDEIVAAVAEMETGLVIRLSTVPASVENKRRADRERIAEKRENERQSRDVASCRATSSDNRDTETSPSPSVSPTPPSTTPSSVSLLRPLKGAHGSTATLADEPPSLTVRQEGEAFVAFWTAYPRKVGKLAAMKAYAKALRTSGGPDPPATILAAVEAAKRDWIRTEAQFIPHPATWLNQGRWMDEPTDLPANLDLRHERPHPRQAEPRTTQPGIWAEAFARERGPASGIG